jgi:hypothetical protein
VKFSGPTRHKRSVSASNRAEPAFGEFSAFISEVRARRMADGFRTGNPRVNCADLMRFEAHHDSRLRLPIDGRPRCRPEGGRPVTEQPGSTAMLDGIRRQWRADRHRRGPSQRGATWHGNAAFYPRNFDLALAQGQAAEDDIALQAKRTSHPYGQRIDCLYHTPCECVDKLTASRWLGLGRANSE